MKKIELGICQVNLIHDLLNILKEEDYKSLQEHGYKREVEDGSVKKWIDDLLDNFCKPLIEHDEDIEIILERR